MLKKVLYLLLVLVIIAGLFAYRIYHSAAPAAFSKVDNISFSAQRLPDNPIIRADTIYGISTGHRCLGCCIFMLSTQGFS